MIGADRYGQIYIFDEVGKEILAPLGTPPFFHKGQRIKQPSNHISTSHIQENVQSQSNHQKH